MVELPTGAAPESGSPELAGLRLLLTRPAGQADTWITALRAAGADIRHVPTLAIAKHSADEKRLLAFARALEALVASDGYCIFISQNAVRSTRAWLSQLGTVLPASRATGLQQALAAARCIAVGASTAAFAVAQGFTRCDGSSHDSESLLALGDLQADALQERRVLLLKGDGGRDTIAQGLRQRGAKLQVLSLYRRLLPEQNRAEIQEVLLSWQPHVVSATSVDSVRNTVALAAPEAGEALYRAALLVPGERVSQFACEQGFNIVLQSRSIDIADVLYSLSNWWQRQSRA